MDEVVNLNVHKCLLFLAYKVESSEYENSKIKKSF